MKKLSFGQKSASSKDKQKPSADPPTSEILLDNTRSSSNDIPPMVWKSEPEMSASILSGLIFLWIQPMFSRAAYLSKRGLWLEREDLPPLANMDRTINVERLFQSAWLAHNNDPPTKEKITKKTSNTNDATTAGSNKDGDAITATSRVNSSSSNNNNNTSGESPAELESRLLHALIATCKRRIIEGGIYRLLNSILQFSFPILLNLILAYYQDIEAGVITKENSSSNWVYYKGYWLSVLLMLFIGTKAITESAYFHKMNRCSWRIKTAVSASIYRKSLRLSSSAQRSTSVGEIVNLMQVDATKIEVFIVTMHTLWDGLFQIAGYMTILGFMIGWPCLVGLLLIIIGTPIMGIITSKMFGLNRAMVRHTDERVKTSNEALQGILCVKMYSWEEPLSAQIDTYRQEELHMLRKIAYLRAFSRAYMSALPTFAAATTFLVYVYATAGDVSASIIFSSIVAFDMLRLPLMFYPNALAQYAQAKVSLRRVATFLGSSEVNTMGYTRNMDSKGEIIVDNATLYWYDPNEPLPRSVLNSDDTVSEKSSKSNKSQRRLSTTEKKSSRKLLPTVVEDEEEMVYPKPILNNVNIHVSTGELCAIVGPVGSGKSTLCSAILNEAVLGKDSHICLAGSVAYVSQTAWILNRTVRENILFGQVYDEGRYNRVIDTCCLRHDLQILEDGDLTEIGERGINLSGGQKQRVSLARAAYANADVYIFDDPLSALDPEVAEIVFDECILGMLQSKTRLLVTNQLQFLSKCDSIIALGTHGHVLEQGTYSDLMTNSDGEVTRLLKNVVPSRRSSIEGKRVKDGSVGAASAASPAKENKKLISNEERQTGTVKFDVYLKYIKAGGGYVLFSAIFFFYLLSTGSSIGSSVWISVWTADSGMGYEKHSE